MTGADASAAADAAGRKLLEVERLLERPTSPVSLAGAVEKLEEACGQWPALMACLTDRVAWESLARQISRLERLAGHGAEVLRVMETLSASARGYTADGEPTRPASEPAKIDCRG